GTVKVRSVFAPSSRIKVKSCSITGRSGKGAPCEAGVKGPYVTPLRKNFSPSAKKNLPLVTTGATSLTGDRRGNPNFSTPGSEIMPGIYASWLAADVARTAPLFHATGACAGSPALTAPS